MRRRASRRVLRSENYARRGGGFSEPPTLSVASVHCKINKNNYGRAGDLARIFQTFPECHEKPGKIVVWILAVEKIANFLLLRNFFFMLFKLQGNFCCSKNVFNWVSL